MFSLVGIFSVKLRFLMKSSTRCRSTQLAAAVVRERKSTRTDRFQRKVSCLESRPLGPGREIESLDCKIDCRQQPRHDPRELVS